jgi:hypothetical protein
LSLFSPLSSCFSSVRSFDDAFSSFAPESGDDDALLRRRGDLERDRDLERERSCLSSVEFLLFSLRFSASRLPSTSMASVALPATFLQMSKMKKMSEQNTHTLFS